VSTGATDGDLARCDTRATFETFLATFELVVAPDCPGEPWLDARLLAPSGYREFADRFAGCSFADGLYRLHDAESGPRGEALLAEAFPDFKDRACPFAYDWLGRQFASDARRLDQGEPLILLAEPGTGQVLETPFSFAAFHEKLADMQEPALAATFFRDWAHANPSLLPLRRDQCVGYNIPLFLGGADTIENLEMTDLDVYWSLCGQLRAASDDLPPGTSIGGFAVRD
jgi:Domain of unknown function (DUF1851)